MGTGKIGGILDKKSAVYELVYCTYLVFWCIQLILQKCYVLCLGAFFALSQCEFHFLAFL